MHDHTSDSPLNILAGEEILLLKSLLDVVEDNHSESPLDDGQLGSDVGGLIKGSILVETAEGDEAGERVGKVVQDGLWCGVGEKRVEDGMDEGERGRLMRVLLGGGQELLDPGVLLC